MIRPFARRRVLVLVVVVVAATLMTLAQTSMATSVLRVLGLAEPDAPFLELYFVDPDGHPTDVVAGQRVPVLFALAGHGGAFAGVSWRIETQQGVAVKLQARGTDSVAEDAVVNLARVVEIPCDNVAADPRTQVRVTTEQPAETIFFWVTCTQAAP